MLVFPSLPLKSFLERGHTVLILSAARLNDSPMAVSAAETSLDQSSVAVGAPLALWTTSGVLRRKASQLTPLDSWSNS